jgi:hypothetical protein
MDKIRAMLRYLVPHLVCGGDCAACKPVLATGQCALAEATQVLQVTYRCLPHPVDNKQRLMPNENGYSAWAICKFPMRESPCRAATASYDAEVKAGQHRRQHVCSPQQRFTHLLDVQHRRRFSTSFYFRNDGLQFAHKAGAREPLFFWVA